MNAQRKSWKILRAVLAAVAAFLCTVIVARPWFMTWGATPDEAHRQWPGDELTRSQAKRATRAITIHASAPEVWAWIVQVGQGRGGFYSYYWLEDIFGCQMHNADRIIPEYQSRKIGDTVWLTPKERYHGRARVIVAELVPNRAMIFVSPQDAETAARTGHAPNGTWGFVLEPIDSQTTRLIMCSRAGDGGGLLISLWGLFAFDPAHFVMERRMMLGIKQRAEKSHS